VLDVRGREELRAAIQRCRQSAAASRVEVYRAARGTSVDRRMAVLVQRMVAPEAAGVAFTANPVTGDRGEVVMTAARGLGERVVSGEAVGDEWSVRAGRAVCRRSVEHAIEPAQAIALAKLAREIEGHFDVPQDIEWAIARGRLVVLQARPMTSLPDPVRWDPPSPGHWSRTLRLGEWLPEATTPLFADWLLERIEAGFLVGMQGDAGAAVPFRYAVVNGWYFTAPPRRPLIAFLRAAVRSRGRILSFFLNALLRVWSRPELADQRLLRRLSDAWQKSTLPSYRRLIEMGVTAVVRATPGELEQWIDEIGSKAGEALWSLAVVGGSAWKIEACLARFLRRHVPEVAERGTQALLGSLPAVDAVRGVAPHAVESIDWYRPPAGELGRLDEGGWVDRRALGVAARQRVEAACREALCVDPERLARFETMLEVAQRYAAIREEQARALTLGWPLLRRCVYRLAARAIGIGIVQEEEDAFFLTRAELLGSAEQHETARRRRTLWQRQRRLPAPLVIGTRSKTMEAAVDSVVRAVRTRRPHAGSAIVGHPASPGRATGAVRLVHGPEDFDRLLRGDVLVTKGTAPAWTPLFARAAAVVTDGGSLAAHASLVAREYGIPAVVGTGDATSRLSDGQLVTVDGNAGVVELE
jgi:pyruvate,water dikinase